MRARRVAAMAVGTLAAMAAPLGAGVAQAATGTTTSSPTATSTATSADGSTDTSTGPDAQAMSAGTTDPSAPATSPATSPTATGAKPAGAHAATSVSVPSGSVAPMTFRRGQQLITAQAGQQDGVVIGSVPNVPETTIGQTAFSPRGTRQFFTQPDGLVAVNPDGSASTPVTAHNGQVYAGYDEEPAVSRDGGLIAYVREGTSGSGMYGLLMWTYTDGSRPASHETVVGNVSCSNMHTPSYGPDDTLIYECDHNGGAGQHDTYHLVSGASTLLISNASHAVYSPDGTKIAFVRADASGVPQVFSVDADGSGHLTQLTTDTVGASKPAWSPDGQYLAYVSAAATGIIEIPAAGGDAVGSIQNADDPSWGPSIAAGHVQREWGSDRLATAIAASQADFAAHGDTSDHRSQAGAVVLARSDNFADALGGSALAVQRNAPLLTTPTAGLDSAVQAEINRVLAPGGTVYLLGGTGALSPAVAQALGGYNVVRLAGGDRYATAASIAHVVNPNPNAVLIATGNNYPDALSAGAVGLPVLLTNGSSMPAATASYLNGLNPDYNSPTGTELITIGGPGNNALHSAVSQGQMPAWGTGQINWFVIAGDTRYATSLGVAETFFVANTDVALATGLAWPDALSGGAMIGHRGSPLLLVDPSGIDGDTMAYLHGQASSLATLHLIGGIGALKPAIAQQAANAFQDPANVQYGELTPGSPLPFPMAAQHATVRPSGALALGAAGAPAAPDAVEARPQSTVAGKKS
jgi:hypothetical protein